MVTSLSDSTATSRVSTASLTCGSSRDEGPEDQAVKLAGAATVFEHGLVDYLRALDPNHSGTLTVSRNSTALGRSRQVTDQESDLRLGLFELLL
jgi:hypothetical protein